MIVAQESGSKVLHVTARGPRGEEGTVCGRRVYRMGDGSGQASWATYQLGKMPKGFEMCTDCLLATAVPSAARAFK